MSINLRTYFVLIFSVFVIVFTLVIGFTINSESSQNVESYISDSLTERANQLSNQLDHFMWSRYGEITVFSQFKTFQEGSDFEEIDHLLEELQRNFPSFSWIGYTDAAGIVRASTGDILLGADISERPVFLEAQEQTFIGDVHEAVLLAEYLPNPSGEPLEFVDISSPIFNKDNEFVGVLAVHLSWAWADEVQKSVIQPIKQQKENLDVFIVSKKDNTVLLGPEEMIGQSLDLKAVKAAQKDSNHWSVEEWPDGKDYLTGYDLADGFLNYPGLDWTVLVRQPVDVAFSSVKELRDTIILIGSLSCLLFGCLGWYLAGVISNPLRQLVVASERLKNGEKVDIPVIRRISDIEILSTSLRNLIATLTQTKSELGKMEEIAQLDKLTGLPNRFALDQYISEQKEASDNKPFAFIYLDLDGFKRVNDEHGHHHGDELLKIVATRIQSCTDAFISRQGGDEFVIILELDDATQLENVTDVSDCINTKLNEPVLIEGIEVTISCSIGISFWPTDDSDPYQVLRYADKALYQSKASGKNQVTYFKHSKDGDSD